MSLSLGLYDMLQNFPCNEQYRHYKQSSWLNVKDENHKVLNFDFKEAPVQCGQRYYSELNYRKS